MNTASTEELIQARIDELEYEQERIRINFETVNDMMQEYRELREENAVTGSNPLLL